jgi:hypothetical protein
MLNLDIFNLPPRYVKLEKELANARGIGNCQGYITGHNGAEACWALALEHKISIKYSDDDTVLEASFWTEDGFVVNRLYFFADFEHPELVVRYAVCHMTIDKLKRKSNG